MPLAGMPSGKTVSDTPMTSPETVVLLHGVGLRAWSMARLALALRRAGFAVVNETYPSRSWTLERLASEWLPELLERTGSSTASKLHFVSHSMGGIVLRLWLKRETERRGGNLPPNLGRVVMIAPPNAGSAVADRLRDFPPFRWVLGVNGTRLGTTQNDVPPALGPWPEGTEGAGVIAGDFTLNPLFSNWLGGPNDGKVAVESARLEGIAAFRVVPFSHPMLPWRAESARLVVRFLREGNFGNE